MKQVDQSELQVGELYCDQPSLTAVHAVTMTYVGKIKGSHVFKYVSGFSEYINEGEGLIKFPHYRKEPNWYYKVPTEKAKIIVEANCKPLPI